MTIKNAFYAQSGGPSEGFPPGEIGRLLQLMQEIDHNGLSDLLKPLRQR